MSVGHWLLLVWGAIVLVACSPHPGSGKWKTISDNELGVAELSIHFDGKAEFKTTKKDIAVWHCFWGGKSEAVVTMNCAPSTDPERRERFTFAVGSTNQGQLRYQGNAIATFERQPYE
jgi:hypothetical protein